MQFKYFLWLTAFVLFGSVIFIHSATPGSENQINFLTANNWPNAVIPEKISFAGESVPVEKFDIREAIDRELLSVAYWHSKTFLTLKRANRWFPVIERILKQYNIPEDFKYLAVAESGLIHDVSPVGAKGMWQFMESTAREYGLEVNSNIDERYHVEKSTVAACKYLRKSYEYYGDWVLVAASYNMGKNALRKMMNFQYQSEFWDLALYQETTRYVYRIIAIKILMENPAGYGYKLKPSELYPQIPIRILKVDSSISELSKWAIQQKSNYKMLKYFNPWLRQRTLANKNKKIYYIELPKRGARDKTYR